MANSFASMVRMKRGPRQNGRMDLLRMAGMTMTRVQL